MLIKPFPHGKGDGGKPVYYLARQDYHGRKEHPPVVLRGDPELTKSLIDSIDREWKYTAGVCALGPEDCIAPEKENELMDRFEAVAFAGLSPDQYNILWVRHSHAGHHELHFVIPRMELSTGKAFNAFPPGWEKDFAPLRDLENTRNEWTRPDDPARTRLFAPSNADITEARLTRWGRNPDKAEKEKAREAINAYVKTLVEGGAVRDRADVATALREAGLEINREGRDYITVMDPESRDKIHLKGGVYGAGWTLEKFGRTHAGEGRTGTDTDGERLQGTIVDLERQLAGVIEKRAAYNVGRYGTGDYKRGNEVEPTLQALELGVCQEVDHDGDLGIHPLPRDTDRRVDAGETRGVESGPIPGRVGAVESGETAVRRGGGGVEQDAGGLVGQDFGDSHIGAEREPLRDGPVGEREWPHHQRQTGNQIEGGEIDHGQKRTGTHSVGLPGTDRDGGEGGTPEPGREDSEDRNKGGGLRAAIDAAIRLVTEFAAAYR
ncbi:MAG: relaxase/mobilization nuclease domain-containing protein, partial [Planctomycetota bacterium]|nr:relaxase/mobilization nuclease domain-containing protein [Planctomycetota bacterium]